MRHGEALDATYLVTFLLFVIIVILSHGGVLNIFGSRGSLTLALRLEVTSGGEGGGVLDASAVLGSHGCAGYCDVWCFDLLVDMGDLPAS